ncbi:sulfotransferase family 2 domain-containing protein [Nodosilinea sp. FACHB-13]|uniref:sulfotransferase family 2 domain-containing protein n=1 Tax=Cyanophyceae TaxID=3028117 RepID=UPI00168268F5|nr:sulfotransferase family 2 domain-containing protein [Nodosilinea sp. FACHB-13]MBD2107744.1 sulfotransferase family 2 domain-containing protein [Nodosilinea sp. FACHB-13]
MSQAIILFTHIPKTGGTSIKKSLISGRNVKEVKFSGLKKFFLEDHDEIEFLNGHYPYGVHHFLRARRKKYYFVILREPLDQAISYYYFVKQCDHSSYRHPHLEDVKKYPIGEFYKIKEYQNIQTKYIAGFPCHPFSKLLPEMFGSKLLLRYAKNNLEHNYNFFGLLENIDACQEILAMELGLSNLKIKDISKITRDRPSAEELDKESKKSIFEANALDFKLYEHSKKVFHDRYFG